MKILLHNIKAEKIGGTTTVISEIKNSYLKSKHEFVDLVQDDACGFNPIKAIRFIDKYRTLINREHADIIYVCGLLYSGFLITLAAKLSNVKKIVVSIHGSEWDKHNQPLLRKLIFGWFIEPLTVYMATSVFTVCKKGLENTAIKRGGHGNIFGAIYNRIPDVDYENYNYGVFRNEIRCAKDKILIAVVGRVVEDKGHRYIIDAIKELNDDRFVFVIVGDGDFLENYKLELREFIDARRVHLLGIRNDVFQILKDCDIFLFATLHENHSKSLLEAIMMHCAVLCTDVGGNPEIIDSEETGIMIPSRNSEEIITGLKRLSNEELRNKLISKALKVVPERFSESNTFGVLDSLFTNI